MSLSFCTQVRMNSTTSASASTLRAHAHTQLSPASRWSLVAIGITAPARTPCCDPLGAKHEIITGVHLSIEACWHLQHTRRPALHALPGRTALHTMATTEQAPQAPYAPHPACPASTWHSSTALSAMRWCSIASMVALRSLCSRATSGPCAAAPPQVLVQPRHLSLAGALQSLVLLVLLVRGLSLAHLHGHTPAWAHTCMGTHLHGHTCMGTHLHGHTPTWAHTCMGTHLHGHTCMGTHLHGHTPAWAHTCMGTHLHGHTCMGTHLHGHTPAWAHTRRTEGPVACPQSVPPSNGMPGM
jgi:hypothetical protein